MLIRAIYRSPIGQVLDLGAAIAHDLVEWAVYARLRRRLEIDDLRQRVHDLEVLTDRREAELEIARASAVRFPTRAAS